MRSANVRHFALVLALVVSACGRTGRTEARHGVLEVIGARAMLDGGGAVLAIISASGPLRVRVRGCLGQLRLLVEAGHSRAPLQQQRRVERGGASVIEVEPTAPLGLGRGRIFVEGEGCFASATVEVGGPLREPAPLDGSLDAQLAIHGSTLRSGDPGERMLAAIELARVRRKLGDLEAAAQAYEQCSVIAEEMRIVTEATRCLRAAARQEIEMGRLSRARLDLEKARGADEEFGNEVGLFRYEYYTGMLEARLGRFQEAMRHFRAAADGAWLAGLDEEWASALLSLATVLAEHGRHAEALQLISEVQKERAAAAGAWAVDEAVLAHNHGWVLALAAEQMPPASAHGRLVEALALSVRARRLRIEAGDRVLAANAAANVAWISFLLGDVGGAASGVADARALDPRAHGIERTFLQLLEGDIALARGRPGDADAAFRAAEISALDDALGQPSEELWRARYGRARVALAGHKLREGEALLFDALSVMENAGARTPIREGRAPYFADRRRLTEDLLELLLARHASAAAFAVADRARAHVARALELQAALSRFDPNTRQTWSRALAEHRDALEAYAAHGHDGDLLSEAERREWIAAREVERKRLSASFDDLHETLSPLLETTSAAPAVRSLLATDEVLIAFSRVHNRWIAFGLRDGSTRVTDVERGLSTFIDDLTRGKRHLYVITGGMAEALALAEAQLPGGELLIERLSISFLPWAGLLARQRPTSCCAPLVVGDPDEDLPFAALEAAAVARASGAELLLGRQATRANLVGALRERKLLHFAGHAVLHGPEPWSAHLALRREDTLDLESVLTYAPGCEVVVLSACEVGAGVDLGGGDFFGLPEAFLVTGTGSVLAADRIIGDREASGLIELFYHLGGAERPAEAYRRTALALRARGDPTWTAFRVTGYR